MKQQSLNLGLHLLLDLQATSGQNTCFTGLVCINIWPNVPYASADVAAFVAIIAHIHDARMILLK